MRPQLTIGIPSYNRPDLLPKALRTAIHQRLPVSVIVTDNGNSDATAEILRSDEFRDAGIRHFITTQPGAWPNWRAAAMACETEYFAWLQHDDVIRCDLDVDHNGDPQNGPTYAERIIDVMDYFTDANVWLSRLACAYDETRGMPFKGNCPWVPMDMLYGKPCCWMGGEIVAASSYLTSWSLSPAQAYRANDRFFDCIQEMPERCEIFIERLVPARLCVGAPIVVDPIVAGYWVQHSRMLHLKQNADKEECTAQLTNSFRCLDGIMDDVDADWPAIMRRWLPFIPPDTLNSWLDNIKNLPEGVERGRYLDRVVDVASEPFENARRLREQQQAEQEMELVHG